VAITPNSKKADRVNAARTLIKRVEFNETACAKGLEGLRAWSYEYDEKMKTFSSEPKHDWASHDGDGFSYGCLVMQQTRPPVVAKPLRTIHEISLNEIWETSKKGRARI
jgi:phage terminase large subunit